MGKMFGKILNFFQYWRANFTHRWGEIGGGKCKKDKIELDFVKFSGVFLVLICGYGASLIIAIFEFLWNIRKVAVREKVRFFLVSRLFIILISYLIKINSTIYATTY